MSDNDIVGMGLVHIKSPKFTVDCEKFSTCDIECSISIKGNINDDNHSQIDNIRYFRPDEHQIYGPK